MKLAQSRISIDDMVTSHVAKLSEGRNILSRALEADASVIDNMVAAQAENSRRAAVPPGRFEKDIERLESIVTTQTARIAETRGAPSRALDDDIGSLDTIVSTRGREDRKRPPRADGCAGKPISAASRPPSPARSTRSPAAAGLRRRPLRGEFEGVEAVWHNQVGRIAESRSAPGRSGVGERRRHHRDGLVSSQVEKIELGRNVLSKALEADMARHRFHGLRPSRPPGRGPAASCRARWKPRWPISRACSPASPAGWGTAARR